MNTARGAAAVRATALFVAASWFGAMAFFALVAGRVLVTSPSRHAGGTVNRALLDLLDVVSFAAAALVLLAVLLLERLEPLPRLRRGMALRLAALAAAAAFASSFVITPEMMALRDRMPTLIDLVSKSDPLRASWGRLHALSSVTLVVRILAAAGVFATLLMPGAGSAAGAQPHGRVGAARLGGSE